MPGARVVDADGHRATVRWRGKLRNGPRPEMIYVGVEWDECGHGRCDGSIFGERHFACAEGGATFLPPQVLFHDTGGDGDALLLALGQATRQVDVALCAEDERRRGLIEQGEVLLTFWARMCDAAVAALGAADALHAVAVEFQSHGAADGRSSELEQLGELIAAADARFDAEWPLWRAGWASAARELARIFRDQGKEWEPGMHPFGPSLDQWIGRVAGGPAPSSPILPLPPYSRSPPPRGSSPPPQPPAPRADAAAAAAAGSGGSDGKVASPHSAQGWEDGWDVSD